MSRGASFYEKLIGERYNYLTIEKLVGFVPEKNHQRAMFLCRCDCGKEKLSKLPHLRSGNVISCGCRKRGKHNPRWQGYEELGLTRWAHYQKGARDRLIPFDISIETAWDIFVAQNRQCALSGTPISLTPKNRTTTASLDRIDSSKGYVLGNVQWLHKDVNIMKRSLTDAQFIDFCHLVAARHPKR